MQKMGQRYLCYKAGYLIDWCRCLNSVEKYDDAVYQVGVFERMLEKQAYFKEFNEPAAAPLALVVEWDDAMDWLDRVVKAEREGVDPPSLVKRKRVVRAATEPAPLPAMARPQIKKMSRTDVAEHP